MFTLPDRIAAKADPALVAADDAFFADLEATLERTRDELTERLDDARRAPTRSGEAALERDQQIHRLTARLRTLRRFGADLCLGRIVPLDGPPSYIGRLGLSDPDGRRLLLDWRSPAAEPFFAATHANPMGLASRRRYRWTAGRVTDYWDEVFVAHDGALVDDESAFLAGLGTARTGRMRDVLGTIQADQDAIIRASARGALVVDGGPGTGKTVVALHRAAYLLYADPRVSERHGGVLVIGPHAPYVAYVSDVLPGLGEDGVQTATLVDLVPEGAGAVAETDSRVAALKAARPMVDAIEAAVALYEEPPTDTVELDDASVGPADWAAAFGVVDPGTPHNEARELILDELVAQFGASARRQLQPALNRAWPLLDPGELVGDLWSVPAYLRRCAPWLAAEEVRALQRTGPQAWTVADLPLLAAARRRLGDPDAAARNRQRARERSAEQARRADVAADLIAADDSELLLMSMLRGADLQSALDEDVRPGRPDRLAGPFAHVVVDEAQELTDAEWQMVLARCPSRSVTVVGDRAQARGEFTESWRERLRRVGFDRIEVAGLTVNYRTPAEVMAAAEPVIRSVRPDANVPVSIRSSGVPVRYAPVAELRPIVAAWSAASADGVACVLGADAFAGTERVRALTPAAAKGLEFDLVVLVEPERWSAVDRFVAMTRTTGQLVVLTDAAHGR